MVSPENVHTRNAIWAERIVFIYLRVGCVLKKNKITKGKETTNLRDSKREPIKVLERRAGVGGII